jgi:hypothetical protein
MRRTTLLIMPGIVIESRFRVLGTGSSLLYASKVPCCVENSPPILDIALIKLHNHSSPKILPGRDWGGQAPAAHHREEVIS